MNKEGAADFRPYDGGIMFSIAFCYFKNKGIPLAKGLMRRESRYVHHLHHIQQSESEEAGIGDTERTEARVSRSFCSVRHRF
jgi:hypothetical protein